MPRQIWILGLVSLLMDASSELVHSLLPLFMATTLGAGMLTIGFVEGIAEATAALAKVGSGALSDRWRRRKPLVVLGYGLAALSKPAFPLAGSMAQVLAARCVDRLGKGIRGAPRDALVADLVPPAQRGAAYGLRQALDAVGAVVGPLAAMVLMSWWASDVRAVLWAAVAPAALAVAWLVAGVREPAEGVTSPRRPVAPSFRDAMAMPRAFWAVVGLGVVFTLARFSEAFLVLRADDVGLPSARVPVVMAAMSATFAAGAYPAGRAADRLGARGLLWCGLATLVAADVRLATASTPLHVVAGAGGWGLHLALTQGCSRSWWPMPGPPTCAERRLACSTWPRASRCWRPVRSPAPCGRWPGRRRPTTRELPSRL